MRKLIFAAATGVPSSRTKTMSDEQVAVAYLHTRHMEGGQTDERLSMFEDNAFGEPGIDYSAEYLVTIEPLYRLAALSTRPEPQTDNPWNPLEGYRAAVSFIAADSWDGCSDCIEVLRAARSADWDWHWTPDEIAAALTRLRARTQLAEFAPRPEPQGDGVALADALEQLRRIKRASEMSAGIMRDSKRTGAWEGAENVASQFDRITERADAATAALRRPEQSWQGDLTQRSTDDVLTIRNRAILELRRRNIHTGDDLPAPPPQPEQSWQELRTTPPQPEQMDTSGFADSGDMT